MSITDFLNARIAEDETLARAALTGIHGKHKTSCDYAGYVLSSERDSTIAQDEFIIAFWPARVLAECAAKRAIVEDWEDPESYSEHSDGVDVGYVIATDSHVRTLAAIYADHPAYLDEWRVGE